MNRRIVTPDLERSFYKETAGCKEIIRRAVASGAITHIRNGSGNVAVLEADGTINVRETVRINKRMREAGNEVE